MKEECTGGSRKEDIELGKVFHIKEPRTSFYSGGKEERGERQGVNFTLFRLGLIRE